MLKQKTVFRVITLLVTFLILQALTLNAQDWRVPGSQRAAVEGTATSTTPGVYRISRAQKRASKATELERVKNAEAEKKEREEAERDAEIEAKEAAKYKAREEEVLRKKIEAEKKDAENKKALERMKGNTPQSFGLKGTNENNGIKAAGTNDFGLKNITTNDSGKNSGNTTTNTGFKYVDPNVVDARNVSSGLPKKNPPIGVPSNIVGTVKVQRDGGKEWVLKQGIALRSGDRIITEGGSKLQILLLDETSFTIGANSDMVLDEFVYDPNTTAEKITVSIMKGLLRWVTGKVARRDPASMVVKTPVGAIGIRGTDFQVTILPDSSGSIKLYKGLLEITEYKTQKIFEMQAGQVVSFSAAGKFGTVHNLIPVKNE